MTRHCPRFFKKVPFEFYLTGEDDGWGLRSVFLAAAVLFALGGFVALWLLPAPDPRALPE